MHKQVMMDHTHKRTRSLTEHRLVPVRIIISYSLAYQKKSEYTEDAGTSEVWNVNRQTHLKVSAAGCASGLWRRNHTSRCPLGHRPGPEDDRHKGALESLLCNRDGAGQPGHPEAGAEMRQKAGKKAGRRAGGMAVPINSTSWGFPGLLQLKDTSMITTTPPLLIWE